MCVLFVLRKAPIMQTTNGRLGLMESVPEGAVLVARSWFERSPNRDLSFKRGALYAGVQHNQCLITSYRGVEQ